MSFWSTDDWEEEIAGLIQPGVGGGDPWQKSYSLDGAARDEGDVAAGNTEIAQFTVGEPAQFVDRLPVAAPILIFAGQVHRLALFILSSHLATKK